MCLVWWPFAYVSSGSTKRRILSHLRVMERLETHRNPESFLSSSSEKHAGIKWSDLRVFQTRWPKKKNGMTGVRAQIIVTSERRLVYTEYASLSQLYSIVAHNYHFLNSGNHRKLRRSFDARTSFFLANNNHGTCMRVTQNMIFGSRKSLTLLH